MTEERWLREAEDGELAAELPSLAEQLDAIPLHVEVWPEVPLDAEDPAFDHELGRRRCIAARKAGGRCTVRAMEAGLLCPAHSGLLDPRIGGQAKAEKLRQARVSEEERARLGRLGTRGVILDRLAVRAADVQKTVDVLLDAATQGDLQAAKLLIPYFNQALGMPKETTEVVAPTSASDLERMSTAELHALLARRREVA